MKPKQNKKPRTQKNAPPLKSTLFNTTKDRHKVFMGSYGHAEDAIKMLEGSTQ
ncbi:MAG: hypothetical protein ACD_62C00169G0007 [uncultured bacterium]|nr:MAG: hypothetical protein ACD_62C00169G0007 [uncultured bacterium]